MVVKKKKNRINERDARIAFGTMPGTRAIPQWVFIVLLVLLLLLHFSLFGSLARDSTGERCSVGCGSETREL